MTKDLFNKLVESINEMPQEFKELKKELALMDKEITRLITLHQNPNRKKIIQILGEENKPLNIREIWLLAGGKKGISYKSIYKNIQVLKEGGLVKLTKKPKLSGQSVMVESINSEENIRNIFKMKKRIEELKEKAKD